MGTPAAIVGALACVLSGVARADIDVVETTHYQLYIQDKAIPAPSSALVLEQAWPAFAAFFLAEPELKEGERLVIKVFADKPRWRNGALGDGGDIPAGVDSVWLSRKNRTVYLYPSTKTEYVTRAHVLYAACLQFHACSKSKNMDLDTWYVHGIAESLATHAWDGKRLALGIAPRISVQDHAASALKELGGERFGLDAFSESRIQVPCIRWSAVRFALEGAGGKYKPRFTKLALGARGSKVSGEDFMRSLGRAENVSQEFAAWLKSVQLPFEAVRGDWEDWQDGRIATRSPNGMISLAGTRGDATYLRLEYRRAEANGGALGILLAVDGPEDFQACRIQPPVFSLETYSSGRLVAHDPRKMSAFLDESIVLEAHRSDHEIRVVAGAEEFGPFTVDKPRLGWVVFGGSMVFDAVEAR
jgi:hypothetical protein